VLWVIFFSFGVEIETLLARVSPLLCFTRVDKSFVSLLGGFMLKCLLWLKYYCLW
ncbi:unnamed protein product, partial [Sphagnum jensenii]